jgi:hypothetical protein
MDVWVVPKSSCSGLDRGFLLEADRGAQAEGAPRRREHGRAARRADSSTAWLAGQRLKAAKAAGASRKKPWASSSRAGWVLRALPEAVEALPGLLRPTDPLLRHGEEGEVCTGGVSCARSAPSRAPYWAVVRRRRWRAQSTEGSSAACFDRP